MNFAISIGELADKVDHHPDLHVSWGELKVDIWTHKINGLTESDFVLAAKIDALQ
jgi:4a-hydroxytetrahydrobiopterin dehydratase